MSADNGIYILMTKKGSEYEYRVAEMMAVENIGWDDTTKQETPDQDIWIKNAREMWGNCKFYASKEEALAAAYQIEDQIEKKGYWTEYGIEFIRIEREF